MKLNIWPFRRKEVALPVVVKLPEPAPVPPAQPDSVTDPIAHLKRVLAEKEQELERLRSAAEERAQEVESYNENILRSVSSGVITFNRDGVVTTFNDAAASILRLRREDVIGKTCAGVFGAQSVVARLLARALAHGDVITREEFELEVPHGGKIWVGVSTSLLKDHAGGLIGTTFVCTDLTEIKALREEIARMRATWTAPGPALRAPSPVSP